MAFNFGSAEILASLARLANPDFPNLASQLLPKQSRPTIQPISTNNASASQPSHQPKTQSHTSHSSKSPLSRLSPSLSSKAKKQPKATPPPAPRPKEGPDIGELFRKLNDMIAGADLSQLTLSGTMKQLEAQFSTDLSNQRALINNECSRIIKRLHRAKQEGPGLVNVGKRKMTVFREPTKKKNARAKTEGLVSLSGIRLQPVAESNSAQASSGGLNKPVGISDKLANFLGVSLGQMVARTQVVKFICDYVKKFDLQDPTDRRHIICDDKLRSLLGKDRVTYFTLNRFLSPHFAKSKKASRKRGLPKGKGGGGGSGAIPTGFNAPMILSPELTAVCGGETQLPRPQVVKRIWAYIKVQKLQDPRDGRVIHCDEKLKKVMGVDTINMMKMNKVLTKHLTRGKAPPASPATPVPVKAVVVAAAANVEETMVAPGGGAAPQEVLVSVPPPLDVGGDNVDVAGAGAVDFDSI